MKTRLFISTLVVGVLQACSATKNPTPESSAMNIIPQPQSVELLDGAFVFEAQTTFAISGVDNEHHFFQDYLSLLIPGLTIGDDEYPQLKLQLLEETELPSEGYLMEVNPDGILITAGDAPGLFYGIQSLRQLLPTAVEKEDLAIQGHRIQAAVIQDHPRFAWRGMHLDVSRHFFPAEFIKRYIDMIALHKMNVFHWHLTDDNGWRLEIKQYPELTEICAWRVDREHEDWRKWSPVEAGEKSTYGGFYTQAEVREIVAYAADRQITVIPEIEMPGHASEIFAAYPELSCKGEKLDVRPGSYWPNEDIFCAGNDSVFTFLENVIDEVVTLFPAEYIHIGGDEATKTYWKTCPKCQNRIKTEGLADEHELQSWFIQKMERYIHSKGKRIIGWDEILEGGLAPDATVMSWRGETGGIAAAKAGHNVIMTPTSHVYFDYYQGDPETEPQAIGGYLPLQKVYSYEPVPVELAQTEYKYVLGAQANLWTEFVKTTRHAEYMVLPRMTALSEVLWSRADQRNWINFHQRLQLLLPRFDALGWNYSKGSFLVEILPGRLLDNGKIEVELISEQADHELRFTLDGSDPIAESKKYTHGLSLGQDAQVRAAVFSGQQRMGRVSQRDFAFHQAVGAATSYDLKYHSRYKGGGDMGLVDGILGSDNFRDGTWQGFEGHDLVLTIDLGEVQEIFKTELNFLQSTPSWIFMPEYIEVSLSKDGEDWMFMKRVENEVPEKDDRVTIQRLTADFPTQATRYIKVLAKNREICPEWHAGAGGQAWIFCDEVIVR
ncbi:MAG: glycoside hydrolase family 20 protein [Candidatus Marinimicrobia bacterium]|nr:glycoside hydrolase family 20 protein [Candidatus Neomarinimicrobiota bacterium]